MKSEDALWAILQMLKNANLGPQKVDSVIAALQDKYGCVANQAAVMEQLVLRRDENAAKGDAA